jgi:FixJ family two-component response regulator
MWKQVAIYGALLAAGRSNKEIAAQLDVSPNTVKTHVARRHLVRVLSLLIMPESRARACTTGPAAQRAAALLRAILVALFAALDGRRARWPLFRNQ